jgi:predicted short-subunit dehydrogenase-like oxidoreductase (DUF2520 family)
VIKKITILGSGNVSSILGKELFKSGASINGIWSKTLKNAKILAESLQTFGTDKFSELPVNSDLYLVAVSDDAIESVVAQLSQQFGYKIFIAHTSGSFRSEVLEQYVQNSGVFYCLQTFTKETVPDFRSIPVFVSATSTFYENKLLNMAQNLSDCVKVIDEDQRKVLHLAAVFANNFVNHIYSVSQEILLKNNLDFKYLIPLIEETSRKIVEGNHPGSIQTGPAIRKDLKIIEEHLKMLEDFPQFKEIYNSLTKSLMSYHNKK